MQQIKNLTNMCGQQRGALWSGIAPVWHGGIAYCIASLMWHCGIAIWDIALFVALWHCIAALTINYMSSQLCGTGSLR